MVCYFCQLDGAEIGASLQCQRCHRWICVHHESGTQGRCRACETAIEQQQQRADEANRAKLEKALWCEFCQRVADQGWKSPRRCSKCSRQFCRLHGQVVWDEYDKSASGWVRCIDHLAFPGRLGDQKRGFNLDLLFGCLTLPFAYIGLAGVVASLTIKRPDFYRTRGYGERWSTFRFKGHSLLGEPKLERTYELEDD